MKLMLVLVAMGAGFAGSVLAQEVPNTDTLVNNGQFEAAVGKSGGAATINMAQAAATLDFCDRKDAANELRTYLRQLTMASSATVFKGMEFDRSSMKGVRGIYIASELSLVKGADTATAATYANVKDLISGTDKKKICDGALKTYSNYKELQQRAAAGRN